MAKLKEIIVKHGVTTKLSQSCGTSHVTVRYALRGYIDNDNARLIRKRAVEDYGGVYAR